MREGNHIAMVRDNPDGTRTPLTMSNHRRIKGSTLRTILTQARIPRDTFLAAYEKVWGETLCRVIPLGVSEPAVVPSAIMNETSRILPMQSPPSPTDMLAWAEQDGVDLSMLRERLRLTPTERLKRHQAALALVEALQAAKRKQAHTAHRTLTDGAVPG